VDKQITPGQLAKFMHDVAGKTLMTLNGYKGAKWIPYRSISPVKKQVYLHVAAAVIAKLNGESQC
jgi:hypothetical protein